MDHLARAAIVYGGIAALAIVVVVIRHLLGKSFSIPGQARYVLVTSNDETRSRHADLHANLTPLGFRPALSYTMENYPGTPLCETWHDETETTELSALFYRKGSYESRILSAWSMAEDGSIRTTAGDTHLDIFDSMPSQRMEVLSGIIDPVELIAAHRARMTKEGIPLRSIADHDLEQRSRRARESLEFQRTRGLLRFDETSATYLGTPRLAARGLRAQLLPAVADFRGRRIVVALLLGTLLPSLVVAGMGYSVWGYLIDLFAVALSGAVAGWMLAPRTLPWVLLLSAVPLYLVPFQSWTYASMPFLIAFLVHIGRMRQKGVILREATTPQRRLLRRVLFIAMLIVVFIASFTYFRQQERRNPSPLPRRSPQRAP